MVGETTALLVEKLMALGQRIPEIGQARNFDVGYGAQAVRPLVESLRIAQAQRAIGAVGGEHARLDRGTSDFLVSFESIRGIVRGAQCDDAEFPQDALRRHVFTAQLSICCGPDFGRRGFVQQFVDAEVATEFQMVQ